MEDKAALVDTAQEFKEYSGENDEDCNYSKTFGPDIPTDHILKTINTIYQQEETIKELEKRKGEVRLACKYLADRVQTSVKHQLKNLVEDKKPSYNGIKWALFVIVGPIYGVSTFYEKSLYNVCAFNNDKFTVTVFLQKVNNSLE